MHRPSLVLLAWDGIAHSQPLFSRLRTTRPDVPVLILATTAEMADYEVFARLGAAGVVLKPFVDDALEVAIAKHLLVQKKRPTSPQEIKLENGHSFVRSSRRMREVEAQAKLVARSDIPVLILGESGTGKEIIAMYTHQMSRRAGKMFLKVNCAAMPADLLESELFGYEQGAFTGAVKSKPGKFEICDGGTIFLDEIGEMPATLQAKLLHVLQDGTFSRLGGRGPTRTDVRVIAATNVNMKEAMARKTFREDLYYRLNGLSLNLPPLRERLDEIPALANYFMRKGAEKYELEPLPLSPNLLSALAQYNWPGNLRELENVINRYLILKDESAVIAELDMARGAPSALRTEPAHTLRGRRPQAPRPRHQGRDRVLRHRRRPRRNWMESQSRRKRPQDQLQGPAVQDQAVRPEPHQHAFHVTPGPIREQSEHAYTDMVVIQFGGRTVKGYSDRSPMARPRRSRQLHRHPTHPPPRLRRRPNAFLSTASRPSSSSSPSKADGTTTSASTTTLPPQDCLWVRATFHDGEVIEGLITNDSHHVLQAGFYMFPIDPEGNNLLMFVLEEQAPGLPGARPARRAPGTCPASAPTSRTESLA